MPSRAEWFRNARWGAFVHYLGEAGLSSDEWNRRVDNFDVKKLASQLASAKVPYFFLTIGQISGYFCSPNSTYDAIVGISPSKCSRRDLIAELIDALKRYDIKMMVYLASHAPSYDRLAVEKLKCTPSWDASKWGLKPGMYINECAADEKLTEFQRNWEAIIREWSVRWGKDVHGWWFDGCYYADKMYRDAAEPNFQTFAGAARSGNENSIVAFNPGVFAPVKGMTEYEDYTAGEIDTVLPYDNGPWPREECVIKNGMVGGVQYHILTYVGEFWGQGRPRFSKEFMVEYTKHINELGGVITWDVPIGENGIISEAFLSRLTGVGCGL